MRNIFIAFLAILLYSSCQKKQLPVVRIDNQLGKIDIEIFVDKAPVTATNFLNLVDKGIYANSSFYRVVRMDNQPSNNIKIEVIQGGLMVDSLIDKYNPITHETTEMSGVKHLDGVVSMARSEPGSASTEFFICIGNQPELDFGGKRNPDGQGFAAFGKVIRGMDVVRKIQQGEDKGQMLKEEVVIRRISRIK